MPAKGVKSTKPKSTKPKSVKSNVAKSSSKTGLLSKKISFNWKIAAVIGLVLVAALGYLFVRLSQASGTELTASIFNMSAGARKETKSNGQVRMIGPGFATGTITSAAASYPRSLIADTVYSVTFFNNTQGPPAPGQSSGGLYLIACGKTLGQSTANNITNGTRIEVRLSKSKIIQACRDESSLTFTVGIPGNGTYFVKVDIAQPNVQAPAPSTPSPNPAAKSPAPAPQGLCEGQNVFGPGSQGGCVKIIQQRLTDLGYAPGAVDGIYGQNTANAVKVFQQRNGLAQDGVVGVQTWNKLTDPNAARKQ